MPEVKIQIEDNEFLCCSSMCDADGGCGDCGKCKRLPKFLVWLIMMWYEWRVKHG